MSDIFLKKSASSFIIDIYTIGYKKQGESIYISVESNDKDFFYDILIDCYKNNVNRTKELLSTIKSNKTINCICLTHYHDDHFTGLNEIIDEYSKAETKVLIPDVDSEMSLSDSAIEIRNKIADIVRYGRTNYGTVQKIADPIQIVDQKIFCDNNEIEFGIVAISPLSRITARNIGRTPNEIEQNDYSISLLVTVSGLKFLFSGDTMNNTLSHIGEKYDINYLKIPHHGSKDSDKILEIINIDEDTVCTSTNYKMSGLPNIDVLNLYNDLTDEVHITENGSNDDFGIIHTRYKIDIQNGDVIYETEDLYNSSKYEKKQVWNY